MANLKDTKIDGDLYIFNNKAYRQRLNVDVKAANNGVTKQIALPICESRDKNNLRIARLETLVYPNGDVGTYWFIHNHDSTGTMIAAKGIMMTLNKQGNITYSIHDNAKFRSALGLGNAATRTVKTATAATDSGWSTTADRTKVPDMAFITYWNGAYTGTNSNLAYCNKGAFGNVCTLEYEQVDSW